SPSSASFATKSPLAPQNSAVFASDALRKLLTDKALRRTHFCGRPEFCESQSSGRRPACKKCALPQRAAAPGPRETTLGYDEVGLWPTRFRLWARNGRAGL